MGGGTHGSTSARARGGAWRWRRRLRTRCRSGTGVLLAVAALLSALLAACTDGSDASAEPAVPSTRGEPVELAAGPALTLPASDPRIDGMPLSTLAIPGQEFADQAGSRATLVLYGDPDASDPFEAPWVLGVAQHPDHDASLDTTPHTIDTADGPLAWAPILLDSQTEDPPTAGLLASVSTDEAQALAEESEVQFAPGAPGVAIDPDALAEVADGELAVLVEAPLVATGLAYGVYQTSAAPRVGWEDGARRLSVTSFAASSDLELLLRAVVGGDSVGAPLVPVTHPSTTVRLGVRTIGDTTVLVQSAGYDDAAVASVLDALVPATDADWAAYLATANQAALDEFIDAPVDSLRVPVLDGTGLVAVAITPRVGPYGPFDQCDLGAIVVYPDGRRDGGSPFSAPCGDDGLFGVLLLHDGATTLVWGSLPPEVAGVRLTLEDGTVVEPASAGETRRLFAQVVPGDLDVVTSEMLDADGRVVGRADTRVNSGMSGIPHA